MLECLLGAPLLAAIRGTEDLSKLLHDVDWASGRAEVNSNKIGEKAVFSCWLRYFRGGENKQREVFIRFGGVDGGGYAVEKFVAYGAKGEIVGAHT